jgi:2-polyprenyl-6-hydroxyphenyl methylase/3-demethylubiquinone-9 3-methyltransferase
VIAQTPCQQQTGVARYESSDGHRREFHRLAAPKLGLDGVRGVMVEAAFGLKARRTMSLTERAAHFEFGENWRNYAKTIDKTRIDAAVEGVKKLFPDGLDGKTFLDIGCGSGLHSLAALILGASSVVAIDIDENSVDTTHQLLARFAPDTHWTAKVVSIFEASPENLGNFDIVYSWGVLHHTGDMWRAIDNASKLVKPDGMFCLAIYAATASDRFWKAEKRIYSKAPQAIQWCIRQMYMGAFIAAKAVGQGSNPIRYILSYSKVRGMNFSHDVHDWLGGYPYETANADELIRRVGEAGFQEIRSFLLPYSRGIFGSGCHEFVFKRDDEF